MSQNTTSSSARLRPYGDHFGDGLVHIEFVLPCKNGPQGHHAAISLAQKMGLRNVDVVHAEELVSGYTFYIIYGQCIHEVDLAAEESVEIAASLSKTEVEELIAQSIKREIIVVGASTGTDTHTVGIDAILNLKGFDGQPGLEAYKGFRCFNLGGQVRNTDFVGKAREVKAEVLLVSQTVTQQRLHMQNLAELCDILEAERMRDQVLLIVGGARITPAMAKEAGFDGSFSEGAHPNDVASFIVRQLVRRSANL